jgi:hypothetical protein
MEEIIIKQPVKEQSVISVKIPKKLKNEMKQIDVNWSEYIRQCIQKKISQQKMKEASDKLDEIRKRTEPTSNEEIVSWIREDRER